MNIKSKQGIRNKRNLQKLSTWDKALYPQIYINYTDGQKSSSEKKRRDGKFTFYVPVITK